MSIRVATLEDALLVAELAIQMWESHTIEELTQEFGSDCELDNEDSLKFHMKMGFVEANRIICFTKKWKDFVIGRTVF